MHACVRMCVYSTRSINGRAFTRKPVCRPNLSPAGLGTLVSVSVRRSYLYVTTAGRVLDIVLGADARLGLVLELRLDGLDLLVAAAGLVVGVLQRSDLRLGLPLQLVVDDLQIDEC